MYTFISFLAFRRLTSLAIFNLQEQTEKLSVITNCLEIQYYHIGFRNSIIPEYAGFIHAEYSATMAWPAECHP
jgi:predicted CDP-diglyceride synthetase/phosphatidate cytidylyltransferase